MATKYVPKRQCVICRLPKPKPELIRIVGSDEGLVLDRTGKKAGRGAYLCYDKACHEKAKKSKVLERQLKQPMSEGFWQEIATVCATDS